MFDMTGMSPMERRILRALWPYGHVIPDARLMEAAVTTRAGLRERMWRLRVQLKPQGWTIARAQREGWALCRTAP